MTRLILLFALLCGGLCGCGPRGAGGDSYIRRFGSIVSPDGKKKIEVTRREKSLVDFKVVDAGSGKALVKDYMGSDAMRWFLWWETPDLLWGYGSDIGYFKLFEFTASGVRETRVQSGMEVPQEVWGNLPNVMQKRMKARLLKSE